jgi:hypothetical protein
VNLEEVRALNAFQLSDYAECGSPSNSDSAGGVFLLSVRDSFVEAFEFGRFGSEDTGDVSHEIADGAPNYRTYTRWQEFADLAAWQEEPEAGEWPSDLTEAAAVALYQIAYRLVGSLHAELATGDDEDEDEKCPCGRSHTRAEHGYAGE